MKRIVSGITAFIAAAAMSLTAFAARSPEPHGQNKDYWCWAAAAKMVVENNNALKFSTAPQKLTYVDGLHKNFYGLDDNGNPTADGAQRSIVIEVHGNDANHASGDIKNIEKALRCAAEYNVDTGVIGTLGTPLNASDTKIQRLKDEMRWREYVVGGVMPEVGSLVMWSL